LCLERAAGGAADEEGEGILYLLKGEKPVGGRRGKKFDRIERKGGKSFAGGGKGRTEKGEPSYRKKFGDRKKKRGGAQLYGKKNREAYSRKKPLLMKPLRGERSTLYQKKKKRKQPRDQSREFWG